MNLGLLRMEVARQIGVNRDTIKNWEGNATKPSLRFIPKIIQFLGYCPYDPELPETKRIAVIRESHGLPRKKMAQEIGLNESTLARWEKVKGRPSKRSADLLWSYLYHERQWDT